MKKTNRILSLILCTVMIITLIPLTGTLSASAVAEGSVATATQLHDILGKAEEYKIKVGEDITETVKLDLNDAWTYVSGKKTLDLNGHTVKITVEKTANCYMLFVNELAELVITDSSKDKKGALIFDADIDSGNHYRMRTVICNKGKLTIYGGDFTPGHYTSYYSAKYAKTVYKMTTGRALENHGTCTIYGGRFVGRNWKGSAIYNYHDCPLTIYDAYLYTKGGADALFTLVDTDVKIYAIKIDCNKETAVEDDKSVTKGANYGYAGVEESMLPGDYTVKSWKNSRDSSAELYDLTHLEIVPEFESQLLFKKTGTNEYEKLYASYFFDDYYISENSIMNPVGLKNEVDGSDISLLKFDVTVYSRTAGADETSWKECDSYSFTTDDLVIGPFNCGTGKDYKYVLTPTYIYSGWNNTYTIKSDKTLTLYKCDPGDNKIEFYETSNSKYYDKYMGYYLNKPIGEMYVPTYNSTTDYEFLGWYDAPTGGNLYTEDSVIKTAGTLKLYGHWKAAGSPSFTKKLNTTTYRNFGTEGVNLTVAATGGSIEYIWTSGSSSSDLKAVPAGDITQVYSNGDEITFRYTGSDTYLRCKALNSAGSAYCDTKISPRRYSESSQSDLLGQFLMYIESSFFVTDRGLCVSGTVVSGELTTGSTVKVMFGDEVQTLKVRSISYNGGLINSCTKGYKVALNLCLQNDTLITTDKDKYGHIGAAVVSTSTTLVSNTTVGGTLTLNAKGGLTTPLNNGDTFQLYVPGYDRTSTVSSLGGSCMLPGDTQTGVCLTLNKAAVLYYGQQMKVMKDGKTLGTFTVTQTANGDTGYAVITYDYNGGGITPYATGKEKRYSYTQFPSCTFIKKGDTYCSFPEPVKDGFVLEYWNDGTGEVDIDTVVTGDKTITAHYSPATEITVTFNKNGGDTVSKSEITIPVTEEKIYEDLPTATREGYTFAGWYDSLGNKAVDGAPIAYAVDHTLTARWEEALPVYPVFTKDLPENYNIINDINGNKLSSSFSVEVNEDCYLTWYLQINDGSSKTAVGNMSTLKLSDLDADLQKKIIKYGATLTVDAKSKKTSLVTQSTSCLVSLVLPQYLYGDISNDGKITVDDARIVLRKALGKTTDGYDFSFIYNREFLAGDTDGNGKIEVADARKILRVAIGLEEFD